MLADSTNSPMKKPKTNAKRTSFAPVTSTAATNTPLQQNNLKRVQALLAEFLAGNPEGYMAGVDENIRGSVLGGLIPGGEAITNKSEFLALNMKMGDYLEMKKFEPCNWSAVGDDVLFNVNWEFVWKPTGKLVETTALVRKVLKDGLICEKYHMMCPSVIEELTGVKQPEDANVKRVQSLLGEYMAGNPGGYMAGVADDVTASMLGGLIPGADAITDKDGFQRIMDVIGNFMEVQKFEPCNFRALPNNDMMFNVNWAFTWKPTGKLVETTAVVRKVLNNDGQICQKYHMVDCDEVLRQATKVQGLEEELRKWVEGMVSEGEVAFKSKAPEQLSAFWAKYYKEDTVLIRPSGNPLDRAGFLAMMGAADVTMESSTLLKVEDIKEMAGGSAAVFTYTSHDRFSYKGTPNDDIAKFSAVVEKGADGWKLVHVHRGTGQKPE